MNEFASSHRRWLDLVWTVSFLVALALPTCDEIVRADGARGPGPELRVAAPRPNRPMTAREVVRYPASFDEYYRDTFGLRDVLLCWNSLVKHYVFRVGTSPKLVPDGLDWINYDGDRTLANARGLVPFTEDELEGWRARLEERDAVLAALGIRYQFVMIPNKETIYPERIPERFNRVGPTRLDQLIAWLATHSTVRILDLRPHFLAEKANDEADNFLYNPLGTHWGGRGAQCAYRVFVERIREWFPLTRRLVPGELDLLEGVKNHDTWATSMYIPETLVQHERMLSVRHDLRCESVSLEPDPRRRVSYTQPRSTGPRLLVYHDSFMGAIELALGATFSEIEIVGGPRFDLEAIRASKPDAVIEIFVERMLVYQPVQRPNRAMNDSNASPAPPGYPELLATAGPDSLEILMEEGRVELGRGPSAFTTWIETRGLTEMLVTVGLECAHANILDVYWRGTDSEPFLRSRRATFTIPVGTRTVSTKLSSAQHSSVQFLMRLRETDPSAKLRSIELRAAKP